MRGERIARTIKGKKPSNPRKYNTDQAYEAQVELTASDSRFL